MSKAKQHVGALLLNVDAAADALQYFDGRILNGFGELSDPSNARYYLRKAQTEIQSALAAFDLAERAGWTKHAESD